MKDLHTDPQLARLLEYKMRLVLASGDTLSQAGAWCGSGRLYFLNPLSAGTRSSRAGFLRRGHGPKAALRFKLERAIKMVRHEQLPWQISYSNNDGSYGCLATKTDMVATLPPGYKPTTNKLCASSPYSATHTPPRPLSND
jgi:hypothetical protein